MGKRIVRGPITLYKKDLFQDPLAEWQVVWCEESGEFILNDRHAWWEAATKSAHYNVPVLRQPFKTLDDAITAFNERINKLENIMRISMKEWQSHTYP